MNKNEQRTWIKNELLYNSCKGILVFESDLTDQEILDYIDGNDWISFYQHKHLPMMGECISESLFHGLVSKTDFENGIKLQLGILGKDVIRHRCILGQYLVAVFRILSHEKKCAIHLLENDCLSLSEEELMFYQKQLSDNPKLSIFTLTSRCERFINKPYFIICQNKHYMNNKIPTVYISYKHYDDCKDLAKKERYTKCIQNILIGLEKVSISYSIDYDKIQYRGSIKNFEEEIGNGLIVIAVITPEYLKSVGCMYELAQVFEKGDIHNRLFPIVDIDRGIDAQNKLNDFWMHEIEKAKSSCANRPFIPGSYNMQIEKIDLIIKHLGAIWTYLCDRNAESLEAMTDNEAEKLIGEISTSQAVNPMRTEKAGINDYNLAQIKGDVPAASSSVTIIQKGDHSIGVVNGNVINNF